MSSSLASAKFKIDGDTNATEALSLFGDYAPLFGDVFKKVSEILVTINQEELENRLVSVQKLVPTSVDEVAKSIALKLTIRMRDYITKLKMADISYDATKLNATGMVKIRTAEDQYARLAQINSITI
mmetsp:Transcript_14502/g.22508  ORF Transcript_14502/g.22508 Transcript_14502/m.22508 type:complete len:127 (-) Transcript_14502:451-831(-)